MNTSHILVPCPSCNTKNRIPVNRWHQTPTCGKCRNKISLPPQPTEILTLTDASFSELILNAKGVSLVDFWAPWCGHCTAFKPTLTSIATRFRGQVRFGLMNLDTNPATAARYQIRSVPALMFFKNGALVENVAGAQPEAAVSSILSRLLQS